MFPLNFNFQRLQLLRNRNSVKSDTLTNSSDQVQIFWAGNWDFQVLKLSDVTSSRERGWSSFSNNPPPPPSDCTQSQETREELQFQLCDVTHENLIFYLLGK